MKDKLVNYENSFWPLVYDNYNRHLRMKLEREFYYNEFKDSKGPILEAACGTGLVMLDLLSKGIDIHGFDLSEGMLGTLTKNGLKSGFSDIKKRVSTQNMIDFKYNKKFDGIFMAARSFLHCVTIEEQLACLENCLNHLKRGGRFIHNLFTPDHELLLQYSKPNQKFEFYESYTHPESKEKIDLYLKQEHDLDKQHQHLTWRFKYQGKNYDSKMLVCWIYRSQFELLLKQAGFKKWELFGGFKKKKYRYGDEMVFIAHK